MYDTDYEESVFRNNLEYESNFEKLQRRSRPVYYRGSPDPDTSSYSPIYETEDEYDLEDEYECMTGRCRICKIRERE